MECAETLKRYRNCFMASSFLLFCQEVAGRQLFRLISPASLVLLIQGITISNLLSVVSRHKVMI